MGPRIVGLLFGVGTGFIFAWARLTDPAVIRDMLLLREPDVFLFMGCAALVAGIGARLLRRAGARALVTNEPIGWSVQRPRASTVIGSVLFGAGWSIAATCPGPMAIMIGEGRVAGVVVVAGMIAGLTLQSAVVKRLAAHASPAVSS
jgi:uncharacterized membrane protein YedE/YeeE